MRDNADVAYANFPGFHVWYTDSGPAGSAVVLLHAASGTSESWVQQVPALTQAGYRCIAYDRRGWGRTRVDVDGELPPAAASDDLHSLAEHLALDRFHLVGTAAGAAVAVDYALSHPKRLLSLVLADGTAGVRDPDYLALLERIRPPELLALPAHVRELSGGYRGMNAEGTRRWLDIEEASRRPGIAAQKPRHHVTWDLLETMRAPTLVVVGDADALTPPAVMRRVAARIPGADWVSIPEAGHASFWEQPDVWNRSVIDFVRAHDLLSSPPSGDHAESSAAPFPGAEDVLAR